MKPLFGQVARGSIQSLIVRLSGLAVAFLQAILTARLLGAEGYGQVAVALSVAQIVATVSMFGFGPLAVREVAKFRAVKNASAEANFNRLALTVVLTLSLLACAVLAILGSIGGIVSADYARPTALAALLVPPLALIALLRGIACGRGRIVRSQLPGEVVRQSLMTTSLLLVILFGFSIGPQKYIAITAISASVAALVAYILTLRREIRSVPFRIDILAGAQIRQAMPFLGLALIGIAQGEINTLLLGALLGPQEAGLFQPIARLIPLMTLPVQAAAMRYAPIVSELWHAGETIRFERVTRLFTLWTSALTILLALGIAYTGNWILVLFGSEFSVGAELLWYMACAQIFNAACGPVGALLTMTGRSNAALAGQLAGLVVNLGLGLWLIPQFGLLGAVLAMSGGIVSWNVILLAITVRHVQFDPSLLGSLMR